MTDESEQRISRNVSLLHIGRDILQIARIETYNFIQGIWDLAGETLVNNPSVLELFHNVNEKLRDHPILGIGLLACAIICLLPVACLVVFIVASIVVIVLFESLFIAGTCLFFIPCILGIFVSVLLSASTLVFIYFVVLTTKRLIN